MKTVGKYTYGNPIIYSWGEGAKVIIGNFCSIADNCKIYVGYNISFRSYKSRSI